MSSSAAGAAAFNPGVAVNGVTLTFDPAQQAREQRAVDCERAVEAIELKLAGLQAALTAAKTEAMQARAEAQNGRI